MLWRFLILLALSPISVAVLAAVPATQEARQELLSRNLLSLPLSETAIRLKNVFAVGDVGTSSLKAISGVLYVGDKRLAEIQYKFRSIGFPFPDDAEFICQTQLVTAPPEQVLELEGL